MLSLPDGISLQWSGDLSLLCLDFLTHGTGAQAYFTTRRGGLSSPPYATLNTGFHVGDAPDAVSANRDRVWRAAGLDVTRVIGANQVHGRHVHRATASDAGRGALSAVDALPDTDAIVTDQPGLVLTAYYADCVPILLLDGAGRSAGVAHAGWKGTALRTAAAAVEELAEAYGAEPAHCRAVIGPSIGPCCYEVDERVLAEIQAAYPEIYPTLVRETSPGHARLDLWEANRQALLDAGLRPENILVSGLCTSCHTDWFFSHRAEAGRTGRMMAVLAL